MSTVLVIDDEQDTLDFLSVLLRRLGWQVILAATGAAGLEAHARVRPDLVLLDLGLPDMSGLEVIAQLRREGDVPVVFLSGTSRRTSRVAALDAGADDFVAKPFDAQELAARLRAVARRASAAAPGASATERRFEDLVIDTSSMTVRRGATEVRLTATEWRLLEAFTRRPGTVVTHRWLVREVWTAGHGAESRATLRAHVRSLRHKLGDDASQPRLLRTESGVGYRWIADSVADPGGAPAPAPPSADEVAVLRSLAEVRAMVERGEVGPEALESLIQSLGRAGRSHDPRAESPPSAPDRGPGVPQKRVK